MRGDVQLLIDGPTLLASQVDSKAVKAIVVTGPQRFDALKDVPTVAEAGFPNAAAQSWLGLVASAGTPDAIIERLSAESQALLGNDEYVKKLKQISFFPTSAIAARLKAEISLKRCPVAAMCISSSRSSTIGMTNARRRSCAAAENACHQRRGFSSSRGDGEPASAANARCETAFAVSGP
jgi:Tripartite tricarboxylate transporter family receptor